MDLSKFKILGTEIIGLRTARARLIFTGIISVLVFILPIRILSHLSLWSNLGINAPSVGLTRAYRFVLHGEFINAWHQNALIFAVLLVGLPLIVKDVYTMIKQLNDKGRHGRPNN